MPRNPNCPACRGNGYIVPGFQGFPPLGTLNSVEWRAWWERTLAMPRARCPDGCEPYHWDLARLDADAKRLPAPAKAA